MSVLDSTPAGNPGDRPSARTGYQLTEHIIRTREEWRRGDEAVAEARPPRPARKALGGPNDIAGTAEEQVRRALHPAEEIMSDEEFRALIAGLIAYPNRRQALRHLLRIQDGGEE